MTKFEVYSTLPSTGVSDIIYLIPIKSTNPNQYTEYVWKNGVFEKRGLVSIDLSQYWNDENLDAISIEQLRRILV